MATDNTTAYIIAAIVVAHFLIGIGYLVYKMNTPRKKDNPDGEMKS